MNKRGQDRSRRQRALRRRRGERPFIFDRDVSRCLGEADREEWEIAITECGGDVAAAADWCGLEGVPRNAKALWGRSAEDAVGTYRRWQKQRSRR